MTQPWPEERFRWTASSWEPYNEAAFPTINPATSGFEELLEMQTTAEPTP